MGEREIRVEVREAGAASWCGGRGVVVAGSVATTKKMLKEIK